MEDNACSCARIPSSPLELLLLGALRYLGRGWTFDDVSESTGMSMNVLTHFFETFCTFGSEEFYVRHVKFPTNEEDYENNNSEFNAAGFTGACASTDAVNIACDKLSWKTRQQHLGHKQSLTARTCNVCVNHRRQTLHATSGFPSRWNDQTIVKILNDIKCGKLYQNATFTLFERKENGEVQEVKHRGAWVICDNGYLKWSMLICPFKLTTNRSEIRFSEWLESMRKDVECAFGMLKQRWRILKTGMRVHSIEMCDKMFKCCCALHNYLLDADGMDVPWEGHASCDYEDLTFEDCNPADIPRSIHELYRNYGELSQLDFSGVGTNNVFVHNFQTAEFETMESDSDESLEEIQEPTVDGSICEVSRLNRDVFRSKLVEHFDILFQQRKIVWPKSNRRQQSL